MSRMRLELLPCGTRFLVSVGAWKNTRPVETLDSLISLYAGLAARRPEFYAAHHRALLEFRETLKCHG